MSRLGNVLGRVARVLGALLAIMFVVLAATASAHAVAATDGSGACGRIAPSAYVFDYASASTTAIPSVESASVRGSTVSPGDVEVMRAADRPLLAAEGIPDAAVIVRGGQSDMPGAGELFSGAHGQTLEDAAAGVPHGTIRSTTAGEIRSGGGTVDYAPEFNGNVGATNYQHVNVTLGESNPFSEPFANPVPKSGRFGGPNYPFGGSDYPYGP